MTAPTLLLVGGGTGGHVFPMIAVADAVRQLAPSARLVFVGSERGLENRVVPERGYELLLAPAQPIRGGGPLGALSGVACAARALLPARRLVARNAPHAVLSAGGYVAGPLSLAARTLSVPLALLEPNAQIGLANRLIAPFVQRAYTAFDSAAGHFRSGVVLETGVPLRDGFGPEPYAHRPPELRVLVFGGSQGARSLNQAVPRGLSGVAELCEVVHQCGSSAEQETRELYAALGMAERARVVPFIEDVPRALARADLVISRAGAGAVAEICAVGRPSLLIPYPYAGDHQRFNAARLVEAGAARALSSEQATPERIQRELGELVRSQGQLAQMAERARGLGRPNAARTIARDLLELARIPSTEREVA